MDFDDDDGSSADNIWARPSPPILVNGSRVDGGAASKQLHTETTSEGSVEDEDTDEEHTRRQGKHVSTTLTDDDAWNDEDGGDDVEDAASAMDKLQEDARRLKLNGSVMHDEPESYEGVMLRPEPTVTSNVGLSSETDDTVADAEAGPSIPRIIPPAHTIPSLTVDGASGQFDDFPDDDGDEFGDFDEQAASGANDDDFGDFDEADTTANFSFDKSAAPPAITVPPDPPNEATVNIPRINLDGSPSFEQVLAHMQAIMEHDHPDMYDRIDRKTPARRVEGLAQVLTTEADRSIFQFLNSEPDVRPFSWKSSQTRMQMMRSLGVPINLDDVGNYHDCRR